MKKTTFFLLLAVTITGCVERITAFSPRRTNTEAHRQADSNRDCLSCHNVAEQRHHQPGDDCLNCHKLAYGGIR